MQKFFHITELDKFYTTTAKTLPLVGNPNNVLQVQLNYGLTVNVILIDINNFAWNVYSDGEPYFVKWQVGSIEELSAYLSDWEVIAEID